MKLDELATDLLRDIFSFCPLNHLFDTFPNVSHFFHQAVDRNDIKFWRQIYVQNFGSPHDIAHPNYDHFTKAKNDVQAHLIEEDEEMDETMESQEVASGGGCLWFQFVFKCYRASQRFGMGGPRECVTLSLDSASDVQRHPISCIKLFHSFVHMVPPSSHHYPSDDDLSEDLNDLDDESSYKYMLCASVDGKVFVCKKKLLSKGGWTLAHSKRHHHDAINNIEVQRVSPAQSSVSQHSDQFQFFTSSFDKTIGCWELTRLGQQEESLRMNRKLHGHTDRVKCILPSRRELNRLVSCSRDKTVRVWDIEKGVSVRKIDSGVLTWCLEEGPLMSQKYSSVFAGMCDGMVHIHPLKSQESFSFRAHSDLVSCIQYIPQRHCFITTSLDRSIRVWDERMLGKEEPIHNIENLMGGVVSLCVDNITEGLFTTCLADGSAIVWNYKTGKLEQCLIPPRLTSGAREEHLPRRTQRPAADRAGISDYPVEYSCRMRRGSVASNVNGPSDVSFWCPRLFNPENLIQAESVGNYTPRQQSSGLAGRVYNFQMDATCIAAGAQFDPVHATGIFNLSRSMVYVWEF